MAAEIKKELNEHPGIKDFLTKLGKDNIGMLAAFLSWSILTSMVPIVVGLVAISGIFLQSPSAQASVIAHLHAALQGAFTTADIQRMVQVSTQHAGLLGIIGILGIFWGGSNVGGSFSTAFQAVFEVQGRNFFKEKLIDVGMIFVFTALMLVILGATVAGAFLDKLIGGLAVPGIVQFVIGTLISLLGSFLLFLSIYLVFPNIKPHIRFHDVWGGTLLAAVLFQILTYIWPIYAGFSHFQRFGAVLFPLLVLTAWIYFFSMITMIGAEVIAVYAIRDAQAHGESVGPQPQDVLPQHKVLRSGGSAGPKGTAESKAGTPAPSKQSRRVATETSAGRVEHEVETVPAGQVERDPAFWLLAAAPLVTAVVAGAVQIVKEERG